MDLLLINPPYFDQREMEERYQSRISWVKKGNMYVVPFEPPLGLASLTAYLKEKGNLVELLDMPGGRIDILKLGDILSQKSPKYVGITAMSSTFYSALNIARIVKSVLPDVKVIIGGVHSTIDPEAFLQNREVDFAVRGEGEFILERLLSSAAFCQPPDADGLCYKLDGKSIIKKRAPLITDLNTLPMPDYSSFPVRTYINYNRNLRGIKGISMLVTRGCPYRCTFCSVKCTMGRLYRIKSEVKVVDEMEFLRDSFNLEGIWFKDSIFNLRQRWINKLCAEMNKRNLKMVWQCNSRVDLVREDEMALMAQSGLMQLDLGIESGSMRSLKVLKKGYTVEQIQRAVAIARKYAKVAGFFMIGIPGETEKDIEDTFELAKSLNLDRYCFSMYIPLPGSELYNQLRAEGKIDNENSLKDLHFTLCNKSYCEVRPDRLVEKYEEINDYFSKN